MESRRARTRTCRRQVQYRPGTGGTAISARVRATSRRPQTWTTLVSRPRDSGEAYSHSSPSTLILRIRVGRRRFDGDEQGVLQLFRVTERVRQRVDLPRQVATRADRPHPVHGELYLTLIRVIWCAAGVRLHVIQKSQRRAEMLTPLWYAVIPLRI